MLMAFLRCVSVRNCGWTDGQKLTASLSPGGQMEAQHSSCSLDILLIFILGLLRHQEMFRLIKHETWGSCVWDTGSSVRINSWYLRRLDSRFDFIFSFTFSLGFLFQNTFRFNTVLSWSAAKTQNIQGKDIQMIVFRCLPAGVQTKTCPLWKANIPAGPAPGQACRLLVGGLQARISRQLYRRLFYTATQQKESEPRALLGGSVVMWSPSPERFGLLLFVFEQRKSLCLFVFTLIHGGFTCAQLWISTCRGKLSSSSCRH